MQTFTKFYGNLLGCGLISDFRFLFNEDDFAISNLISVISARAYEISPSVGPLVAIAWLGEPLRLVRPWPDLYLDF